MSNPIGGISTLGGLVDNVNRLLSPCAVTVMPQEICSGSSAMQACRKDTNLLVDEEESPKTEGNPTTSPNELANNALCQEPHCQVLQRAPRQSSWRRARMLAC